MNQAPISAVFYLVFATLLLGLSGCTQGVPEISATQSLPALQLDTDRFESKALGHYDVLLSGRTIKSVESLEISLDDGATWEPLENNELSRFRIYLATCDSTCNFSYGINDVGTRWPTLAAMSVNEEKRALLRGQSLFGVTAPRPFFIKKLKAGYISVGSLGVNELGGQAKTLGSRYLVKAGRLEAHRDRGVIR